MICMNKNLITEVNESLRNLLKLDSLPAIGDPFLCETITDQFLSTANEIMQPDPRIVAIGGGPGAGKSYFYELLKAKGRVPKESVMSDPDLIMQAIPQYQQAITHHPVKAFEHWELPARQLTNDILLKALMARYHIVYMRSFALPDSLEFIHQAKMLGYKVDIHLLICDVTIAMSRSQEREKMTKRHLPKETLVQRHAAVSRLLSDIKDAADNFYFYENNHNGLDPVLIESSVLVD
jgi:predicted ABC-type ATPase